MNKNIGEDRMQAQGLWNSSPCGSQGVERADIVPGSLEWFDEVARLRYKVLDPWLDSRVPWGEFVGKRLLEIGHGLGTDLVRFARNGAVVHAIDITEEHHRMTKMNLATHGLEGTVTLCDATAIAYPNASFDGVYSMGVLHHMHDTEAAIAEAFRVLKPGGQMVLALYNFHSLFHYQKILVQGILGGKLFRLGYRGLLATIEQGADGRQVVPMVRLFSRRSLRQALSAFSRVEIAVDHFNEHQLYLLGPLIPKKWHSWIGRHFGWYVFATATK